MRKHYLDNLRWCTVLLVVFYHVCYLFNGVGVLGGIPGAESLPFFDALLYAPYPWFMALLFAAAGMSARYALERRGGRAFLRERARKLLVPSTLGLLVLHWVTGYLNIKMGGGLAYIPGFLLYPIAALSGTGPLWFAQMLFLFSCTAPLLNRLDREGRLYRRCGEAGLPLLLLLAVLIWGAAQVGNVPVLTMYRFGVYYAAFLIGYFIFSHERVQERIERVCLPMLAAAVLGGVWFTLRWYGRDYTAPECLQSLGTNLYLWAAVLAVFGCFRRYFDRETPLTRYLTRNSFGIYVLHYPVLITVCYLLHFHTGLPPAGKYLIAIAAGFGGTLALNECLRRVPVVRFLVLGIKKTKNLPGA